MLKRAFSTDASADVFGVERALPLLRACWPAAVGPRLAERTEIVSLHHATLVVRVPDARYTRILFRLRREILERLRESLGNRAPRALGFVEGAMPPPARLEAASPDAPRKAALSSELIGAASTIADEEIRALFVASASVYLAQRGRV